MKKSNQFGKNNKILSNGYNEIINYKEEYIKLNEKIDFEDSTSYHNNNKKIMSEIYTKTKLNNTFYYTKTNSKAKNYASPLLEAINKFHCDIFKSKNPKVVVCYEELSKTSMGDRTHKSFGLVPQDSLKEMYNNKEDNHLYECIISSMPRKIYFDVDGRFISIDHNKKLINLINEIIGIILNIDDNISNPIKTNICYGEGIKSSLNSPSYKKGSFHIVVNDYYFKNQMEQKLAMNYIENLIETEDKFKPLRDGNLDFKVYNKNQLFKLPFQTKVGNALENSPIKQIPRDGDLFEDYLIQSHFGKNIKIDVDKFLIKNMTTKIIKYGDGTSKKMDFNSATIIQKYKNSYPPNFTIKPFTRTSNMSDVDYYLLCIPNNNRVPKLVWKCIGYCLRNLVKDFESGLEKWKEWTIPYKIVSCDDLRMTYSKMKIGSGYGWKMLSNMAKVFNPKIENKISKFDDLFEDTPTYPCITKIDNSKYIDKEFFKTKLNEYDNLVIKSGMGTGKSWTLKSVFSEVDGTEEIIEQAPICEDNPKGNGYISVMKDKLKYKSILYLSCKRAFASSMSHEFKDYGFRNYLELESGSFTSINRLVCSVESIYKCRDQYDLVIIDESESICDNLTGDMFLKNCPVESARRFYNIVKYSKKVIIMDAFLTTRSHNFLKEIKLNLNNNNTLYYKNNYKNPIRRYVECNKPQLTHQIRTKLEDKKRCVFMSGSSTFANEVYEDLKKDGYNILIYTSKNPLPLGADVLNLWKKCDLLIYTPTITAGISYDAKNEDQYDNLFMYSVNVGSAHFRDMAQASRRVRKFKNNIMYLCLNDKYKGHDRRQMPIKRSEIIENENKYKNLLFGDEIKSLSEIPELNWVYNINIHNIQERNVSQLYLKEFAQRYLDIENISKVEELDQVERYIDPVENEWDYDSIKNITTKIYEDYNVRINSTKSEYRLTDDEFKEYYKFRYLNLMCKEENDIMKEYFTKMLIRPQRRGFIRNIMNYTKMLDEIKYDYNLIKSYSLIKNEDETKPQEYYNLKYIRYEHITKIFSQLKILENGKFNVNKKFYGSDFEPLLEEYSLIPIKTLNFMLKNNSIRTKKKSKDEGGGNMTCKTIHSIFNAILREEFSIEMYTTGNKKYITIDKKRKKLSEFGIRNYIGKNELSEQILSRFQGGEYLIFNLLNSKYKDLPIDELMFEDGFSKSYKIDEDDKPIVLKKTKKTRLIIKKRLPPKV